MATKSKTAYQIYHDEQFKLYKAKGISGNDANKEIGSKWSSLTTEQKKPYLKKKEEYDEQIKRESQVLKKFSKKTQEQPPQKQQQQQQVKETRSSSQNKVSSQTTNTSQSQKTKPDEGTKTLKFTKAELQSQKSEPIKKVIDGSNKVTESKPQNSKQAKQPEQKPAQTKQVEQKQQQQKPQIQHSAPKLTQQLKQVTQSNPDQEIDVRHANHSVYLNFYKEKFAAYKKRFPNRDGKELTQVIKEEWKCIRLADKLNQKEKKESEKQNKKFQSTKNENIVVIEGKEVEVPKLPISSFMRFYQKIQPEIKRKNPELSSTDVAREASQIWNSLPKDKQDEYNQQYLAAKAEYQKQKSAFEAKYKFFPSSNSQKKQSKPSKKAKSSKNFIEIDGEKVFYPIRLSGYYVFDKAAREQIRERNQQYDSRSVSSFIGESWKKLSQEEKDKYQEQSEKEYERAKAIFIKQYGQFPEKPKPIKSQPSTKPKQEKQPVQKSLNAKRPSTAVVKKAVVKKPEVSLEEKEEQLNKKHNRKMQINYDDVESEIEDILSENEEDEDQIEEEKYLQQSSKISLKTKDEEEFEQIEKFFTKNKKVKTDDNKVQKPQSVSKSRNSIHDMLNQPIDIPDFNQFSFF